MQKITKTKIKLSGLDTASTQHSEKIQNKPQAYSRLEKHHVLPKTNSEQSVLALVVGAMLSGIGIVRLKHRK